MSSTKPSADPQASERPSTSTSSSEDKTWNPYERPSREDPFGTRFLKEDHDVYAHNAWDGVDFPPEKYEEINRILEQQRAASVEPEKSSQLLSTAADNWDNFYSTHQTNFFKDRKWLYREFPELFKEPDDKRRTFALEVGCGVGNTTFPLLEMTSASNSNLFVYSCDFSKTAISFVQNHAKFDPDRLHAFVWDITRSDADIPIADGSLDFILCVYVLSALPPEKHTTAFGNLARLLKKGGILYVKDYARHDLTQLRFKKERYIDENFYARNDGTFVYFFDADELDRLLTSAGLERLENFIDKRLLVNRASQVTMYRRWIQCKYVKT